MVWNSCGFYDYKLRDTEAACKVANVAKTKLATSQHPDLYDRLFFN